MKKIAFTVAVSLSAASLPAYAASEEISFDHEGSSYSYTVKGLGDAQLIRGTTQDGTPFRLIVTENRVRGTYNGNRVSFSRDSVQPMDLARN